MTIVKPKSHLYAKKRTPLYGKLNVKNLHPEVKRLWYSKDEELPDLEIPLLTTTDTSDFDPIEKQELDQCHAAVWSLLDNLTEREKEVLTLRLEGELTLQEIGDQIGTCKERVRQIEAKAIRRVRSFSHRDFFEEVIPDSVRHNPIWFHYYNERRLGENVLAYIDIEKPETFFSVFKLFDTTTDLEKHFEEIMPVFKDRFLKYFSHDMLTFKLTDNEWMPKPFIFVNGSDFLAQCVDELLVKELNKHQLRFQRSTYQQTLIGK